MTDPTPTRAEVDIDALIRSFHHNSNVGKSLVSIKADNQALRERAEAAEKESAEWRDQALRKADALTKARRAEAAAWNDAIEAAADKLDLLLPSKDAIRALRRAAPTEDR